MGLKLFRAFRKDMKAYKDYTFEEGKTYEIDEKPEPHLVGFDVCQRPLNPLMYDKMIDNVYYEVDVDGDFVLSKPYEEQIWAQKMTIGSRMSISELIEKHIDLISKEYKESKIGDVHEIEIEDIYKEIESESKNTEDGDGSISATFKEDSLSAANGVFSSAVASSFESIASVIGNWSVAATNGPYSISANIGFNSLSASSGKQSISCGTNSCRSVTTGDSSISVTTGMGSCSIAEGNSSIAASNVIDSIASVDGKGSVAVVTGTDNTAITNDKDSIAVASGCCSKAKGVLGSYLILTEYDNDTYELKDVRLIQVDGDKYKPDKFYRLMDGEIKEVEEDHTIGDMIDHVEFIKSLEESTESREIRTIDYRRK